MELLTSLFLFVILSIVVEHIVNVLKQLLPSKIGPVEMPLLLAVIVGIATAVLTSTDLLSMLGFTVSQPAAAWVLTGIACAGGSKMAHELIAKLRASRQDIETLPDE